MEWRPIETAPKDGTFVLGYAWECVDVQYNDNGMRVTWFERGSWQGFPWASQGMKPTHWQPLPAPPKDTAWIDAAAAHDFNDES